MVLSIIFFVLGILSLFKYRATKEKLFIYIALSYFSFSFIIGFILHYLFV
ncbi:hypothetical protein A5821_000827 [Enterococcus sp. 7F3_DIV0205]|uniref:Uncharacterized protein n=1 Tax=Candidatus Enterococcus palustris TaxID=1834189 RepID=A0AAQ3WCA4_9ENTE|nr:hypothetical protein A5821_001171 [Enterococcus sp. 7F3_DIV0205]